MVLRGVGVLWEWKNPNFEWLNVQIYVLKNKINKCYSDTKAFVYSSPAGIHKGLVSE